VKKKRMELDVKTLVFDLLDIHRTLNGHSMFNVFSIKITAI